MAKRKRLTPAKDQYLNAAERAPEVKSVLGPTPPIAQVVGEASAVAALQEVTAAMQEAKAEGRLVQRLPLASVIADHLNRDRMMADAEDLSALVDSIREHGQRTPIEVMELKDGQYGLISGWRRLTALELLAKETDDDRFTTVFALLRRPENASDAYVAMVEENEVRVGLSYYERARVVALAVKEGVFPTEKRALGKLFATASRAKRSKIGSFLKIYHALDTVLRFPTHLAERQGLQLAKALEEGGEVSEALKVNLDQAAAQTPEQEHLIITRSLSAGQGGVPRQPAGKKAPPVQDHKKTAPAEIRTGVFLSNEGGYLKPRLVVSGPKVDAAFQEKLRDWLKRGE